MSARLCLVKQTVEPKLEPTMIRISNYKYILQQAPKNKASTSTKLLQSRPARPSGRSTSKENSIRIPYNSFTFFSGKYVPKHRLFNPTIYRSQRFPFSKNSPIFTYTLQNKSKKTAPLGAAIIVHRWSLSHKNFTKILDNIILWPSRITRQVTPTVDGSEIPNNHLGCIKPCK